MQVVLSNQTRTRVNKKSKQRRYITRRYKGFSRRNIQSILIKGVTYIGAMRDIRTLLKINNLTNQSVSA